MSNKDSKILDSLLLNTVKSSYDEEAMFWLLQQGADVNAVTEDGATILYYLIEKNQLGTAQFVMSHYFADPTLPQQTEEKKISLFVTSAKYDNVPFMDLLLKKGCSLDETNLFKMTALYMAASKNNLAVAEFLLRQGANPNARVSDGETPLIRAAANGYFDMCMLLLNNGAAPHLETKTNMNALLHAIGQGSLILARTLLAHAIDLNRHFHRGLTPLIYSVFSRNLDMVQLLIDYGADINMGSSKKRLTPLMTAIDNNDRFTAQFLLSLNPDVNLQDSNGQTALMRAAIMGWPDFMSDLLNQGADPFVKDNNGRIALDYIEIPQDQKKCQEALKRWMNGGIMKGKKIWVAGA